MHIAFGIKIKDVFHHVLKLSDAYSAGYALTAGLGMTES